MTERDVRFDGLPGLPGLPGLTDCDEQIIGTKSQRVDSDNDGIPDAIEWQLGSQASSNFLLTAVIGLGEALVDAQGGRVEEARRSLEEALAHFREFKDILGEAYAFVALASVLRTEGEELEADKVLELGRTRFDQLGAEEEPVEAALVLMALADLAASGETRL